MNLCRSLVVLLFVVQAGAGLAVGATFEGDVHATIDVRKLSYWEGIYLTNTQELAYSVRVLDGSPVNVSLIYNSELDKALDGDSVAAEKRSERTMGVSHRSRVPGMFALVIEKNAAGNCTCKVDITRTQLPFWEDPFLQCIGGAIVFFVIIAALVLKIRTFRRMARLAPPVQPPVPIVVAPTAPPPAFPLQPAGYPYAGPKSGICKYCGMMMGPQDRLCPRCLGDQDL
jgi:hypothetical protein